MNFYTGIRFPYQFIIFADKTEFALRKLAEDKERVRRDMMQNLRPDIGYAFINYNGVIEELSPNIPEWFGSEKGVSEYIDDNYFKLFGSKLEEEKLKAGIKTKPITMGKSGLFIGDGLSTSHGEARGSINVHPYKVGGNYMGALVFIQKSA